MSRRRIKSHLNIKTVNLKKNLRGTVQNIADAFSDPTMAKDILNMHCLSEGTWTSDKNGYTVLNASGTAYASGGVVDGLHWFTDDSFVDHVLMAIAGKLQEINVDTGVATDVDASAGFTAGEPVDFQTFNYNVFMCDGTKAKPRKYDGTSGADAGGWPVSDGVNTYSTPTYAETFQGRLATADHQTGTGAKSTYRSHLILSDVGEAETYTLPATAANHAYVTGVGTGDGQKIRGMRSILIPNQASQELLEQLVVFKDRSIYVVVGRSALLIDADALSPVIANETYGAYNNRCIVKLGNDIVALNEYGLITVQATVQGGNLNTDVLESDLVRDIIERINQNETDKCWAMHLPWRREVWFFVPTGASTVCNEAIIYRYPNSADKFKGPRYSRREDSDEAFLMSSGVVVGRKFYVGSTTGIVGEMFTASKYATVGVPFKYHHYPYDFGNEKQIKSITQGQAKFKVKSNQTATLKTIWHGGNKNQFSNPLTLDTTVDGAEYGTAEYGDAYYGEQEEISVDYRAPGNGEKLEHILTGTNGENGVEYLGIVCVPQFGAMS